MEENEIDNHVTIIILELANDEGKSKHKKNEAKDKRIMVDSVKDHLIPHIAPLKISK